MHSDYRNPTIRQLRDLRVSRDKKLEQVNRTEKLLNEIDPQKDYSYEYICFRVTNYRPDTTVNESISGDDVQHDLRLLVEDVSDSANVQPEEISEPVLTVDDLSRMFKVSSKTISRWRQQGLVSRRFILDGRKRVGFLQSSVDRFVSHNRERVKRGERFSQLTEDERQDILDRARRLARVGGCPAKVAKRIARHTGRSVETIRYTIKHFDEKHPQLAIFPGRTGPLSEETKQQIYQRYRRGISPDNLAKQYCRAKSSIHRIINEMRANRILELPLDLIDNELFAKAASKPSLEAEVLGPTPDPEYAPRTVRAPSGLPQYLASLYSVPLLTRDQEQHLFRKFNFLKFKASKLRESLDPTRARASEMNEIETLYDQAVKIKNEIVQANLRLVVSIAKRHVSANDDFFTLVSDGNMSLIRAVEKFDYARGNKFSTYASWAIMKNYARTIPEEYKQRDRFRTSQDEAFVAKQDERTDRHELESAQDARELQVGRILSHLDEREQKIIVSRFGLDYRHEPQTLKEVGEEMGVTKERVRQLEARALSKLRHAAQEENIDLLD